MQLIIKNRIFVFAALMMTAQQTFVALSTVAIGRAGADLTDGGGEQILSLIFWFFTFIAAAYICGAFGQWLSTLLGQNLWREYVFNTYKSIAADAGYSSENNRRRTHTWLTGEAFTTLESACELFVNFISLLFNIFLTLAAFQYLLGGPITIAVAAAFILSFILMYFGRPLIDGLAKKIQAEKMTAFLMLDKVWHNLFFGTNKHVEESLSAGHHTVGAFRKTSLNYKIFEQVLACAPILLTFPIIYWIVAHELAAAAVSVGALVAVLPRTLQLFQNLHMLNVYISQLVQQNSRLQSLLSFAASLDRRDLTSQINIEKITIRTSDGGVLTLDALIENTLNGSETSGRYTVTGSNGSGKSTFLKILKSKFTNAVLLGAEIEIGLNSGQGSTGQKALQQLREILTSDAKILLLDEWDANLDEANRRALDQLITEAAARRLVIEVRHS